MPLKTIDALAMCLTLLVFQFISFQGQAQCNTTLNKLLPEASVNNDDWFGSSMAANGQYMVVGAETSDTLGIYYGGAAYVYEKTVAGWAYRAMLTPSDSEENDFFGNKVAIDASGNTIVVIDRDYSNGGAYIFEKPVSGWQTMQETANIKFPGYLEFNSALDISDDGSTIVVSNPMAPNELLYLLRKPASGWTSTTTPETLATRTTNSNIWIGNDVYVQDDYIYASTGNEGIPSIYVYKKGGGSYSLIAKLSTSSTVYEFGNHLTVHNNTIAAAGLAYEPATNTYTQAHFLFQKNGEWADMTETAKFSLPEESFLWRYPIELISPTQLTARIFIKEGAYYRGKIIEMTTSDGTWQDVSVETLFKDDITNSTLFGNSMVWNGSDLLMAATWKKVGHANRNSILSLTKSAGLWGSLQQVTLPRNSSSNVYFGTSIVKTQDAMFAGAPYDGSMGDGAGAVYVYDRIGADFVKTHTIFPPPRKRRPTGGADAGFGYSVAVYGDDVAVGAPSYLYAPNSFGKIFMYRRSTDDWRSAVLYDSLIVPESLELNHVGSAIAMNDHVLFASAYNNFAGEHTNAVVVFEKINNKWSFRQLIKMGRPLDKSWPSVKFSLNGDQLAIGEFFTIGGGVSVINKDPNSGMWKVTATIPGVIFSGMGGAVKLLDNHLFVGVPGLTYNNVYRSGAVLVFTKLPGESWQSNMQASAVIGAQQPIEGAFFGSSVDVVGNTLAVGAPGMFLTFDSQVRTIPGNTYIIQSQDYYWKNTTQYLNLQGDRYAASERDHFGSHVTLDEEYFYVGARSEHTATGQFSGAVYYIPTPPVIFLEPPVCRDAQPVVLKAYPSNGTWTGTGVDTALGTFDPALTGAGIFTLTYSTPNCSHQGTVQIEVKTPISVRQLSPAEVFICSEANTTLELESASGANYNWYYRQEGGNGFQWIAKGGASFDATNPGEYKAIVSSECSVESPVFRVRIENFHISVGPQPIVCSPAESVSLVASNNTGIWEGTGVSGSQFNATGRSNGIYPLTYRISTPLGCNITLKDSIKLNAVMPLTVNQSKGDFCETGAAALQVMPADKSLAYTWYYRENQSATPQPIDQVLSDKAIVYKQGYYQVSATNNECSNVSNTLQVGFISDLPYTLVPAENSQVALCNADDFTVTVQAREGTTFTWQFKPAESDDYQVMDGEGSSQLVARKTGFYAVKGTYGFCTFESSPVALEFLRDQLFVPNVFTPNGDDKNAVMKVETNATISRFTIFNRFGDEIHSNAGGEWDGGEQPTGVYFWYLQYITCDTRKEAKGWVQLLR